MGLHWELRAGRWWIRDYGPCLRESTLRRCGSTACLTRVQGGGEMSTVGLEGGDVKVGVVLLFRSDRHGLI